MSVQEILSEIQQLPVLEQKQLLEELSRSLEEEQEKPVISEQEFLQMLYAEGVIGNIPDLNSYSDEDDDFEPVEVEGKPTSEIIIEERR
jgi:hypothetical protein